MAQKITSAKTSVNTKRVPAIYNKINWDLYKGKTVFDWGAGVEATRNLIKEKLKPMGIKYIPYDPYNMPLEEAVRNYYRKDEADVIICSNVLNVIDDEYTYKAILRILNREAHNNNVDVYISIYQGDHSGIGKKTTKGYQRNNNISVYRRDLNKLYEEKYRIGGYWKLCRDVIWNNNGKDLPIILNNQKWDLDI